MKFGDIVTVDLPRPATGSSREQIGSRPAIIFHADAARLNLSTLVIVPLTSSRSGMHFQGSFLVHPSAANGLSDESVVLVHQIRAIDKKRIKEKLGRLAEEDLEKLRAEIKAILGL